MMVSAWNNGGCSFGISIDKKDRDAFFKDTWKTVRISFRGGEPKTFEIKDTFWNTCPEIRDNKRKFGVCRMRRWFKELDYVNADNTHNWKGKRPKLKLTPLDNDGSFDLVP